MNLIKKVLIERDGVSPEDAEAMIQQAREELDELLMQGDIEIARNVCEYWFGLELDYLDDLLQEGKFDYLFCSWLVLELTRAEIRVSGAG